MFGARPRGVAAATRAAAVALARDHAVAGEVAVVRRDRADGALLSMGVELVEVALVRACCAAAGLATGEAVDLGNWRWLGPGGDALLTLAGVTVDAAIAGAAAERAECQTGCVWRSRARRPGCRLCAKRRPLDSAS